MIIQLQKKPIAKLLIFGVLSLLVVTVVIQVHTRSKWISKKEKPIPCAINSEVPTRDDIWAILENCQMKTGIELGVWKGDYSELMLKNWKSCRRYYLVDPWLYQKNYKDWLNLKDSEQGKLFEETQARLANWKNKTDFLRLTTKEAAPKFRDNSIDFVYIDARHDYCATKEDIRMYWPKVRCGGILAGHDYKWTGDVNQSQREGGLDWGICENGERHEGSVKRAVDEFVAKNQLKLTLTQERGGGNPSWLLTKPN